MKSTIKLTLTLAFWSIVLVAWTTAVQAEYKETMDPEGRTGNLASYGLVDDNAKSNQSDVFQKAIDDMAGKGGGRLIVSKGTYRLGRVLLKSNIHLLIEAGTVIKPYWPEDTKVVVFNLDAERPEKKKKMTSEQERAFIENVSIRGTGGRFTVDYSDREHQKGEGSRAILCKMVRNFLIENMDVKDNYTTYCGITLAPMQSNADDVKEWEVSRATDGLIRDCRIFKASPGYGLTQLHGAQSVHFEDLYAEGGVTLRLETGALGPQTAVFDITAKNVTNEKGRCAVMLGPHSAENGAVHVDGVTSIGSSYAVTMGKGSVKKAELERNPDATSGRFADGSSIRNIRAVFGRKAQTKKHCILEIPEAYYGDLTLRWFDKFFEGPSIGAVRDSTEGAYRVVIENVTMEGFTYNADKPILTPEDFRPGKWPAELKKWEADLRE